MTSSVERWAEFVLVLYCDLSLRLLVKVCLKHKTEVFLFLSKICYNTKKRKLIMFGEDQCSAKSKYYDKFIMTPQDFFFFFRK